VLDLCIALDVTTDEAGSGFYGGFIVGDTSATAALHDPLRHFDMLSFGSHAAHCGLAQFCNSGELAK
jgi:hypothetical protein